MRPLAAALLVAAGAAGCSRSATDRYEYWLSAGPRDEVRAYETYLRSQGVDGILATRELLRTGRRWRPCRVDEFSVPPRELWPRMVATLVLVRDLQRRGLLRAPHVASGWRSESFNRCEGGSLRSRHLDNAAIDFDIEPADDDGERLCRFWRESGPHVKFGLGFYSSNRIHVDTAGFRTWGYDHHRSTSLCLRDAGRTDS